VRRAYWREGEGGGPMSWIRKRIRLEKGRGAGVNDFIGSPLGEGSRRRRRQGEIKKKRILPPWKGTP